jgi:hypothetical protein
MIIGLAGGPVKRFIAKLYIKNKRDQELIKLINSQKLKDVLIQQKKVLESDVLVIITQLFWMHFPAIVGKEDLKQPWKKQLMTGASNIRELKMSIIFIFIQYYQ